MLRWLLRAKRLSQNPPSMSRVKLALAVVVICIVLFVIERYIGWPDALTLERTPRGRFRP